MQSGRKKAAFVRERVRSSRERGREEPEKGFFWGDAFPLERRLQRSFGGRSFCLVI